MPSSEVRNSVADDPARDLGQGAPWAVSVLADVLVVDHIIDLTFDLGAQHFRAAWEAVVRPVARILSQFLPPRLQGVRGDPRFCGDRLQFATLKPLGRCEPVPNSFSACLILHLVIISVVARSNHTKTHRMADRGKYIYRL